MKSVMLKTAMWWLIFAVALAVIFVGMILCLPEIPHCEEDQVLIGEGYFNGNTGWWSGYICGPAVDNCTGDMP